MRAGAWLVLALLGCSEAKTPPPRGLRVPLPEGWVATAGGAGVLLVGPKGRAVLTLERRAVALPSLEVLTGAIEAEGGSVVRASGAADSTLVRYSRPPKSGLLVVRTLEGGAQLFCASTPSAESSELDAAESLCAGVRLEAVR